MALIPLNQFRTITKALTTTSQTVYVAPVGVTSIVLMAQISNSSNATANVSFIHHRNIPIQQNAQGNNAQPGNTDSFLADTFPLPGKDSVNVLSGKLVIETLDSIKAYSAQSNACTLVLSILESSNA